jgi:signal transduction histidine kinase
MRLADHGLRRAAFRSLEVVDYVAIRVQRLRLSVRNDGIGGADPGRGSGLVGLRDRVEALGGTPAIHTGSGAGTSLRATLPVGDDARNPST